MPEGLARMNNLPDVAGRATKIGDVVIAQETIALDEACDELGFGVELICEHVQYEFLWNFAELL